MSYLLCVVTDIFHRFLLFFFFKQKTAYEMRISDWSSDVCSSDLPPLHEFLPTREEDFAEVAAAAGVGIETLKARANELHEFNPMLGHRGCRLGVTYPEIYEMQARAIFEAACDVAAETGAAPIPEVMIPLVATRREFDLMK